MRTRGKDAALPSRIGDNGAMAGRRLKWRHAISLVLLVGLAWLLIEIGGRPDGGLWSVSRAGGGAADSTGDSPDAAQPPGAQSGGSSDGEATDRVSAGGLRAEGISEAVLADRLGGVLHQAQQAIEAGRIGAAWTALGGARDWPLTAQLAVRREAVRRDLLQAQRAAVGNLQALVQAGRILEAECLLAQLREGEEAVVVSALQALAEQRRWVWPMSTTSLPAVPYLDTIPAVARGRPLRARIDGVMVDARFVRQRETKATIEVRDAEGSGVRYPSVSSHAIEPVAATLDEAVGQCVEAWRDGNREAAVLWLAYARELGADARVEQLGRALVQ